MGSEPTNQQMALGWWPGGYLAKEKIRSFLRPRPAENIIGIDLRSLALFRVCLATLIIADLLVRLSDLTAHYTDLGVLPRSVVTLSSTSVWGYSLHLATGSGGGQFVLFAVHLAAAILLVIGYRTRLATVLCWLLTISLHVRNPYVLSGADDVFRLMLLWGMFLPLGARFSVDCWLKATDDFSRNRHTSVATVAILIQVSLLYIFTFLFKWHPIWVSEFTALYYMFNLDLFANQLAPLLLEYPTILKGLTGFFIYSEIVLTVLVWSPFLTSPLRIIFIAVLGVMHLGIAAVLGIGFFPFLCCTYLLLFLPSSVWDALRARMLGNGEGMRLYFNADDPHWQHVKRFLTVFGIIPEHGLVGVKAGHASSIELLPRESWKIVDQAGVASNRDEGVRALFRQSPLLFWIYPATKISWVASLGRNFYATCSINRHQIASLVDFLARHRGNFQLNRIGQCTVVMLLAYVIAYNVSAYDRVQWRIPSNLQPISTILGLHQNWRLFAPYPMKEDGWFVIPGNLRDGTEVDLWEKDSVLSWEKPEQVRHDFKNNRWLKYMNNLRQSSNEVNTLHFGKYLCRTWNSSHVGGKTLETFAIVYVLEQTPPPGGVFETRNLVLWRHDCFLNADSLTDR